MGITPFFEVMEVPWKWKSAAFRRYMNRNILIQPLLRK